MLYFRIKTLRLNSIYATFTRIASIGETFEAVFLRAPINFSPGYLLYLSKSTRDLLVRIVHPSPSSFPPIQIDTKRLCSSQLTSDTATGGKAVDLMFKIAFRVVGRD